MLNKLFKKRIWKRLFYERLSEPFHLNFLSFFIGMFGSYRKKTDYDLIVRQQNAFGLFESADMAISLGKKRVTVIEFGVASGAGLINIQKIAENVTKHTGIEFDIFGFDTGMGMPKPKSFRDHPELYSKGDFPMDYKNLSKLINKNTKLVIGEIDKTLIEFCEHSFEDSPIGYISIDVDYYSSTLDALKVFNMKSDQYLPRVIVYLDDIEEPSHNSWCGEIAAINQFSQSNDLRKIEKYFFLKNHRLFKNANWIDHIYQAHILDHPVRNNLNAKNNKVILDNPYIKSN
ncbi:MAG: hypothetical protein CMG00_06630 [Candidatus Marinimicrobia bacterium]|nr:hypothetical protein [Candidatus Neomarinimicrobiota bacterium]